MSRKPETDVPLPKPNQITLGWLRQHVPLSWWAYIFVILGVIFSAGGVLTQWEPIYNYIQNKSNHIPDEAGRVSEEIIKDSPDDALSISVWEGMRQIRDMIHCRIDLSFEYREQPSIEQSDTERARVRAEMQLKTEQLAITRRLLEEIDKHALQIIQIRKNNSNTEVYSPEVLCPKVRD